MRAAALLAGALLILTAGGCGGGDDDTATTAGAGTTGETVGDVPPSLGHARPSPRDTDAQRGLQRELRQRGLGGPGGWRFAELQRILVRGREVRIETRFAPRRRDAAESLCLAARQFFLRQGQGQVQTLYDVAITGRGGGTLAVC